MKFLTNTLPYQVFVIAVEKRKGLSTF